jgi:methylase of polypeptide subunit release factors
MMSEETPQQYMLQEQGFKGRSRQHDAVMLPEPCQQLLLKWVLQSRRLSGWVESSDR